jgi:hypothetical protein
MTITLTVRSVSKCRTSKTISMPLASLCVNTLLPSRSQKAKSNRRCHCLNQGQASRAQGREIPHKTGFCGDLTTKTRTAMSAAPSEEAWASRPAQVKGHSCCIRAENGVRKETREQTNQPHTSPTEGSGGASRAVPHPRPAASCLIPLGEALLWVGDQRCQGVLLLSLHRHTTTTSQKT